MLDASTSLPFELSHARFVATPLTTEVAALDYAAYMASPDVIREHSGGRWPLEGFTFSDDLELVAQHQTDHRSRRSFAFVLLAPSRTEALGCLYLNPLREYLGRVQAEERVVHAFAPDSAMVTFWVRQDHQATGLAEAVAEAANDWLVHDWPLDMHVFRVLPEERSSRVALERLSLTQVHLSLPGEVLPYLWYQPDSSGS